MEEMRTPTSAPLVVRCIDSARNVEKTIEVGHAATLEDILALLAMSEETDMDDVKISLTPPSSPPQLWHTSTSSDLLKMLTQMSNVVAGAGCTVYYQVDRCDVDTFVPEQGPGQAVAVAPQAAPENQVKKRVLALFQNAGAAPQPTEQARAEAGPAHFAGSSDTAAEPQDEVQRRVLAAIQQKEIDENLIAAMEYTPEAFASVTMLYVECRIHGQQVKAFVDSGAQMSVMNTKTAERCGLMRLLDRRMRGVAKGVGVQRILGRIHLVTVDLNGMFIPFSFSVLENQDMDVIIGLDQLRRHRMKIDLMLNCLLVEDTRVPFLPESELPDYAKPRNAKPVTEEELLQQEEETKQTQAAHEEMVAKRQTDTPQNTCKRPLSNMAAPAGHATRVVDSNATQLTAPQAAAVDRFLELTGHTVSRETAIALMAMANWDVAVATELFYDT